MVLTAHDIREEGLPDWMQVRVACRLDDSSSCRGVFAPVAGIMKGSGLVALRCLAAET